MRLPPASPSARGPRPPGAFGPGPLPSALCPVAPGAVPATPAAAGAGADDRGRWPGPMAGSVGQCRAPHYAPDTSTAPPPPTTPTHAARRWPRPRWCSRPLGSAPLAIAPPRNALCPLQQLAGIGKAAARRTLPKPPAASGQQQLPRSGAQAPPSAPAAAAVPPAPATAAAASSTVWAGGSSWAQPRPAGPANKPGRPPHPCWADVLKPSSTASSGLCSHCWAAWWPT
jgi:hypothetical protein